MKTLTLCLSTHRPESLSITSRLMVDNQLLVLEEPPHEDFTAMLDGRKDIAEQLLEIDVGYPAFSSLQYRLLREYHQAGKQILQIEPYHEHLSRIQFFLADDHSPKEITGTTARRVYETEKKVTGILLEYYQAHLGNDLELILSTMNRFAKADAARFRLRDQLRAEQLLTILHRAEKIYIEAGSIHLLLCELLKEQLPADWRLKTVFADHQALQCIGSTAMDLFSPGDLLTLHYIQNSHCPKQSWQALCGRSLVYSKIIRKEEIRPLDTTFPHTRQDIEAISLVQDLSVYQCKKLFAIIRNLSTTEAFEVARSTIKN